MTPPDEPPPGPFFADSDDDDYKKAGNEMVMDELPPVGESTSSLSLPQTPRTASSMSSPAVGKLFLDDSDDEELVIPIDNSQVTRLAVLDDGFGVELLSEDPRLKSEASIKSRSVSLLKEESPPPPLPKKRRLSEDIPSRSSPSVNLFPAYLGELIVPNAWSNVSGKGYVKINDTILVRKDEDESEPPTKSKAPAVNTKKKSDNKKQLKLSSMLKVQPAKGSKKKKDNIVRLVNQAGFEFGRLPTETSWWVSKLLELGLIKIRGVMTDCPERLTTGIGLIVTLRFYLLAAAFKPIKSSTSGEDPVHFAFNEGLETEEESSMRERKNSIVKLFEIVGLKPQAGAGANAKGKKSEAKIRDEAIKRMKQRSGKKVKEIVGDGEEIEVDEAEELSKSEIDTIYNRAQKHDQTLSSMEPADTFNMTLRGYQKQALFWMHSLETGSLDAREASSMHPLWSEYFFPQPSVAEGEMIDLTADEMPFYFNPYSGEMSLTFPRAERTCKGGILADEMGMGKTIMLSALIQTSLATQDPDDADADAPSKAKQLRLNSAFRPVNSRKTSSAKPPSATLIVAPTSLLNQWADELERSSKPGTFQICLWHGSNRADLDALLDEDNDDDNKTLKIVITSYGILASEHAKLDRATTNRPPVFDITWWRVILDEAHSCKSRTSKTAKAVYALSAKRKWAVTGTPIINKLEDLFSLLKFLDFKPWSEFAFFRSFITIPFLASDPKAIEVVQIILESILLRREKTMRDTDGKRIIELPPKEILVEQLEFTPLERKIYDSIYHSAKRNFEQLDAKGLVGKNYTHILAMLMRLRRAVLHPNLVVTKDDERALSPAGDARVDVNDLIQRFAEGQQSIQGSTFADEFVANLKGNELGECPICFGEMENPMIIPDCMHQFCKDCIVSHIGICEERSQQPNCPSCNIGPLEANKLVEIVQKDVDAPASSQASDATVSFRRNDFQSSTKLEALIQNLRKLRAQDPYFRAVVFSQFTSFLDLIEIALDRERFEHHRFDGTMDIKKKGAAINEFKTSSRKPKVLVISLKAGGVGLNLTAANHVFMMDCWWNAAVEHQAIDRVHRIGQDKTVYVTHFIISKTIEKRILKIQKRKTAIVNEAFRGSSKADPQSLQNLKIMFGADDDDDDSEDEEH
ncbi:SNF2 family N-terminal domain-containing protein [Crepidotus variabilis]|uniref:SNF2 family N-terminal domain-containing protein n=1 Tax=Crepidotus variabilis TaxID=179855 RepID=A0A9P6JTT8_9AGAR|nr:SNF2 family N-terminal domain-containing protein [Crepidotus variabilis]